VSLEGRQLLVCADTDNSTKDKLQASTLDIAVAKADLASSQASVLILDTGFPPVDGRYGTSS
jgi:hypothetical protein